MSMASFYLDEGIDPGDPDEMDRWITANAPSPSRRAAKAQKWYGVQVGRTPGVYRSWDDAQDQVRGFSRGMCRAFSSYAAAADFVAASVVPAAAQGAGHEERGGFHHKSGGSYADEGDYDDDEYGSEDEAGGSGAAQERHVSPDPCVPPPHLSSVRRWYSVQVGRRPGVYASFDEAQEQVRGFSRAVFHAFNSYADAVDFVSAFDGPAVVQGAGQEDREGESPRSYDSYGYGPEEEVRGPTVAEERPFIPDARVPPPHLASVRRWYGVQVGLRPGVYASFDEAQEQVRGFSRAVFRAFNSFTAAVDYVEAFTRPAAAQSAQHEECEGESAGSEEDGGDYDGDEYGQNEASGLRVAEERHFIPDPRVPPPHLARVRRWYGVQVGRMPGIYTSWAKAQEQVRGFSRAVFRAFDSYAAAVDFVAAAGMPVFARHERERRQVALRPGPVSGSKRTAADAHVRGSGRAPPAKRAPRSIGYGMGVGASSDYVGDP